MKKRFSHILHIFLFSLVVFVSLSLKVSAAENEASADYAINMFVRDDLTGDIECQITFTNIASTALLNHFQFQLPFVASGESYVYLDDQSFPATLQVNGAGTMVSVEFGSQALRPNTPHVLRIQLSVSGLVKLENGIYYLLLPRLNATYGVNSVTMTVNFPVDFPPVIYKSKLSQATPDPNIFTLDAKHGALIIWAEDEVIFDIKDSSEVSISENVESALVNLIPNNSYQEVLYKKLEGADTLGADYLGNVWGLVEQDVSLLEFEAKVINNASGLIPDFAAVEYHDFSADSAFPGLNVTATGEPTRANLAYAKTRDLLVPESSFRQTSREELTEITDGKTKQTTAFGYSYLLASYLSALDLKAHVTYGYLVTPSLPGFDMLKPHCWVEVEVDGQVIIMDPYLEDLTGFDFSNFPRQTRVAYGVWLPTVQADSVLGVLTGSYRERPQFTKFTDFTPSVQSYEVSAFFPQKAFSGEYYGGVVSIANMSNYIIPLADILYDGVSLENTHVRLTPEIKRALPPQLVTNIQIDFLREPNFLSDGNFEKTITVIPDLNLFTSEDTEVKIMFVPDQRLLGILLIVIIVLIFALLLLQLRLLPWREFIRIRRS